MSPSNRTDISVVIPVYGSATTLPALIGRLLPVLDGLRQSYQIIFVEDAGPDDSWEVLCALRKAHPERIVAIQLMRNSGQHNALMCGFRFATGKYIITMDDDLQNPPEEIPKLVNAIEKSGLDVIYGRYATKQHAYARNLGTRLVNIFFRTVFRISITVTSFRILRRQVVESILSYNLNYTFIDGLLAWNTNRIGETEVEHHPRSVGRSGYSLSKLITLALNLFTNYSLLPLQISSVIGFFTAVCGFISALYYLTQHFLSHIEVPGYASIIVAILVLGGLQLLSLGILGEYLGRVHLNINRKPQYTVRYVSAWNPEIGQNPATEDARTECVNLRRVYGHE